MMAVVWRNTSRTSWRQNMGCHPAVHILKTHRLVNDSKCHVPFKRKKGYLQKKKKHLIKIPQHICFQNVYLERRMAGHNLKSRSSANVSSVPTLKAIILSAFIHGWFCVFNWIEFGTCYGQSFHAQIQKCHRIVYKNWVQSLWKQWSLVWKIDIEGWIWLYSQLNTTNSKPLHIKVDVASCSLTAIFHL